jgi:hypothetical protein
MRVDLEDIVADQDANCTECSRKWVSGKSSLPPCYAAHATSSADRKKKATLVIVDGKDIGAGCPMACEMKDLRDIVLSHGFNVNEYGKAFVPTLHKKLEGYRTDKLQYYDHAMNAKRAIGYVPYDQQNNVMQTHLPPDYQLPRPYGDFEGAKWLWDGQAIVRGAAHDPAWAAFEDRYFTSIAPAGGGLRSQWCVTSSSSKEGGKSLPIKLPVSGGAVEGFLYVQKIGTKEEFPIAFDAWSLGGGVGLNLAKCAKWFQWLFGKHSGSVATKDMPSTTGIITLGSCAKAEFSSPRSFNGTFVMMAGTISAIGGGGKTAIWFGVPDEILPQISTDVGLSVLAVKCKGYTTYEGFQLSSPGAGLTFYRGTLKA